MEDWEIDFRTSITENALKQMFSNDSRPGFYAKSAMKLVSKFFNEFNRFPVSYDSFWEIVNDEKLDTCEHLVDGPIVDAAYFYVEDVDRLANLYGVEQALENKFPPIEM